MGKYTIAAYQEEKTDFAHLEKSENVIKKHAHSFNKYKKMQLKICNVGKRF